MKLNFWYVICIFCFLTLPGWTQDSPRLGIIFNPGNILEGRIEEYKGGIGVKVSGLNIGDFALNTRGTLGVEVLEGADNWGMNIALGGELPLLNSGWAVPYTGVFTEFSYRKIKVNVPGENSSSLTEFREIIFGPVFGAEMHISENVSVFAEYQLALRTSNSKLINNGVEEDPETSWTFRTGLGNRGLLGIVIYFSSENKDAAE